MVWPSLPVNGLKSQVAIYRNSLMNSRSCRVRAWNTFLETKTADWFMFFVFGVFFQNSSTWALDSYHSIFSHLSKRFTELEGIAKIETYISIQISFSTYRQLVQKYDRADVPASFEKKKKKSGWRDGFQSWSKNKFHDALCSREEANDTELFTSSSDPPALCSLGKMWFGRTIYYIPNNK